MQVVARGCPGLPHDTDLLADRDGLPLAREFDNLIILRTFSKWAGLAGLRLGYGIFPADFMPYLWKVKQPYNVNIAALLAAHSSFEDLPWLRSTVVRIRVERARLFRQLRKLTILQPYPSQGNFLFCRVLRRLRPGGVLATFSCSGLVSSDLFQKVVFGASIDAGRPVQILESLRQSADHPVALTFPEGEYLKGLLVRVAM